MGSMGLSIHLVRFSRFAKAPHLNMGVGEGISFYPRANPEAKPIGSFGSRCFTGFEEVDDGKGGKEWRLIEKEFAIPVMLMTLENVG